MKFNVQGKELLNQLSAVSKVLGAKNALSIFDNFLLTVKDDYMTITGSDQETVLISKVEIMDVEGAGSFCVNAKRLIEMIKEVATQPLTFDVNENTWHVEVSYLNGYFEFMGISGEEFPTNPIKNEGDEVKFQLPVDVVRSGLDYTLFAVSADTIRPIMMGICVDIADDSVTFVSSDTHKLVRYINSTFEPGITSRFIMPSKTANILRGILGKEEGLIMVTMDDVSATFIFDRFSLSTRFIKGNYPNYNRVIPVENPYALSVDRQTLLSAMRRVSIFASKASSLVSVGIQPGKLRLESQDLDLSIQAREEVICDYNDQPMVIGFNAQYMIEVLSNLPGDSVKMEFSLPSRPGLFLPEDMNAGESLVMLQMPMQVIE